VDRRRWFFNQEELAHHDKDVKKERSTQGRIHGRSLDREGVAVDVDGEDLDGEALDEDLDREALNV